MAIQIDPEFHKSYYRKAKALWQQDSLAEAAPAIEKACELDPDNSDYLSTRKEILEEWEIDKKLPPDHPEKIKFEELITWMKIEGAEFPRLKMRFYDKNYRGVHSLCNIKKNDCILYVPKKLLLTLESAFASPIGKQMYEKNLR